MYQNSEFADQGEHRPRWRDTSTKLILIKEFFFYPESLKVFNRITSRAATGSTILNAISSAVHMTLQIKIS